ncbi:3'-exoribonuclease [Deltaproteobacteria bacterium]|nr:3'-exoribonuclease [Deltaproteobacteria bacterium]
MSVAEEYCRPFSKEDVNTFPLYRYEGPVALVRTREELQQALERVHDEPLLGVDTESKPSFRKGNITSPSLIQIACSDTVFLIQLSHIPFSEEIASLFTDPRQIKTGVAIRDDMRMLGAISPFTPDGLVDLKDVAQSRGLATNGLRTLAANLLRLRISKSSQCSNWSQKELSARQIIYAATDAWVSRLIYERMRELGFLS